MPPRTPDLTPVLATLEAFRASVQTVFEIIHERARARVYVVPVARDGKTRLQDCIADEWQPYGIDFGEPGESKARSQGDADNGGRWDLPVPVERLDGAEAVWRGGNALRKFVRRRDQPPEFPDRLPGLIWAPERNGNGPLAKSITAANRAKDAFKHAVRALGVNHMRRRVLFAHTPLQHVMLIQAWRQIVLIQDPVASISFSWTGASRTVCAVTLDELLAQLDNSKILDGTSDWQKRLLGTGDEEFARVRRIAPFPVAHVRGFAERTGDPAPVLRSRANASQPIVLTGPVWPEVIRDLRDYSPGREPGLREKGRTVEDEPLIPQIGIHRYIVGAEPARGRGRKPRE